MSLWPQWDQKVEWGPPLTFAVDPSTGREAYYGPLGEPGTPDPNAAQAAWPDRFVGWHQPDGRAVFFLPDQGMLEALLAVASAPLGLVNDEAMQLWFNSEGMPADAYNPCATMATGFGETFERPFTAPFYPSAWAGQLAWAESVTVGTRNHVPGAELIVTALQQQLGLRGIYDAIHNSSWCPGCPNYPSALYAQLQSAGAAPPPSGGGTNEPSPPGAPVVGEPAPPGTVAPADAQQGWNQVLVVVTETLPVATGMLDTIAHTLIGGN